MIADKKETGFVDSSGYKCYYLNGKNVREHILAAEKALGRKLSPPEIVHHVDGDKLNNSPSNLVICPNQAYHIMLHCRQRALDECGHADWMRCAICGIYDAPANLYIRPNKYVSFHRACKNEYRRAKRLKK